MSSVEGETKHVTIDTSQNTTEPKVDPKPQSPKSILKNSSSETLNTTASSPVQSKKVKSPKKTLPKGYAVHPSKKSAARHRVSSPTADGATSEDDEERILDEDVKKAIYSKWPKFPGIVIYFNIYQKCTDQIPELIDFRKNECTTSMYLPLLIYILRNNNLSALNISSIKHILDVFFLNEAQLYRAYNERVNIKNASIQKRLLSRGIMIDELLKELNLKSIRKI